MIEQRRQSDTFAELAGELIGSGNGFRFQARGRSMFPSINDGDILHVLPIGPRRLKIGDIVLFRDDGEFKAHRIVGRRRGLFITRGDAGMQMDNPIERAQILGKVVARECSGEGRLIRLDGVRERLRFLELTARRCMPEFLRGRAAKRLQLISFISLLMIAATSRLWAQGGVALDQTAVGEAVFSAAGCPCTQTFTIPSINVTSGLDSPILVVGVSMQLNGNANSKVTTMTFNGQSLTNDINQSNGNEHVEIWHLTNPPAGTSFAISATISKEHTSSIGIVIGAVSLYRVNVAAPIANTAFAISSGSTSDLSVTIPSTACDGVLDTLAVPGSKSVTSFGALQSPVWNIASSGGGSGTGSPNDVEGAGSLQGGATSVTMTEKLGSNTSWIVAAVDIAAEFPCAVTAAKVNTVVASPAQTGVALSWRSGAETHNLGFNVYRDVGGSKTKLNPSLIAGSALLMRDTLQQHGAKSYGWIDPSPSPGALYWLEDVDLNGTPTMHGPITVDSIASPAAAITSPSIGSFSHARKLTASLNSSGVNVNASAGAHVFERVAHPQATSAAQSIGFRLAGMPAVKILVDHEGWYRVAQPQLLAAGLRANANGHSLHLYAEGVEQPMRISGHDFGPQSAIEFYGTAIDTPYSGRRVYWLVQEGRPGLRVEDISSTGTAGPQAQTFLQTLELKPRSTYFAALLREGTDNFFGPLVSPASDTETLNVANLASGQGTLSVALQGITQGQRHDVTVVLNGSTLGDVVFADQQEGRAQFAVPVGVLTNGANTITLTAQQGSNDLSLVDTIRLSFPHTYTAESDLLKFTAGAGQRITVDGFSHPPSRLVDITDPLRPMDVDFSSAITGAAYTLQSAVPWATSGQHTLIALSDAQLSNPAAIVSHQPSGLHTAQPGAEFVIVTAPQFAPEMQPLAEMHRAEGKSVAVVTVDQIYDEFNFGEASPFAIRTFLKTANATWKSKPQYLLLGGDASVDPRNYLGFGSFDFVPTRIIPTAELKTASDDWFSDFNNTGIATIATGRLPARTVSDAQLMVSKIVGYAKGSPGGWNNQALLVADADDPGLSFTKATQSVQKLLPANFTIKDVFADVLGAATRQTLIDDINSGQLLVNYNGHGSVQIWAGSNLFDDSAAASLTNGNKLPVFVIMNCLNGFFHDVYTQSLAESLMLSPNGGAVAVWASSGLTNAGPQFQMNDRLMQTLFSQPSPALGDAVLTAKSGIADMDVKRTFILFGDPAMRLHMPGASNAAVRPGVASQARADQR